MPELIVVTRNDRDGMPLADWASAGLANALCDLAEMVMSPRESSEAKFRSLAVRGRTENLRGGRP